MKLTINTSNTTEQALVALAGGSKDREVLRQLAAYDSIEVKREVIRNLCFTEEDREELYKKDKDKSKLMPVYVRCPLNSTTIHQIVIDCKDDSLDAYGNILYQSDMTAESLKLMYENIRRNKACNSDEFIMQHIKLMAKHKNADEELLERIMIDFPESAPFVMRREDIKVKIAFCAEVEE